MKKLITLLFILLYFISGNAQNNEDSHLSEGTAACNPEIGGVEIEGSCVIVFEYAYIRQDAIWRENDGTPAKTIHVCWESPPDYDYENFADEREFVKLTIQNSWEKHSKLEFVGWTTKCPKNDMNLPIENIKATEINIENRSGAFENLLTNVVARRGVRIFISDDDEARPRAFGLGSFLQQDHAGFVGLKTGKFKGVILNFEYDKFRDSCDDNQEERDKCNRALIVHEFGHILGFAHEQQRPIPDESNPNFEAARNCMEFLRQFEGSNDFGAEVTQGVGIGEWDLESEMNYCNPEADGILSQTDIEALQQIYGMP